jgi:hypothetical protein
MQFTTPRPERIDGKRVALAHLVSLEGIPWYSRTNWHDHLLTLERATKESGTLVCPWQTGPKRWATLVSASLMEREEPYCLPVELCRGVLHRLRERSVAWQSAGYHVGQQCRRLEAQALKDFMRAAMHQSDAEQCDNAVTSALQYSYEAIDQLLEDAAPSIGAARKAMAARVPPFLGAWSGAITLEENNAINLTRIPVVWGAVADSPRSFDWDKTDAAVNAAEAAGRRILLGPMIRWTDEELPQWLGDQVKTFEELSAQLAQYVYAAAKRYQSRAMVIEVADRVSRPTPLGLEPMQQLQLLTDAVKAASNASPSLPRMVTIGLPFGESMATRQSELSPLHFADYLLRSESGLSAIGLEIDCAENSLGYATRDPLDVAKLLERWAALGQPLLALLHVVDGVDHSSDTSRATESGGAARIVESREVIEYAKQMTAISFSIASVQGVLWCPEEPLTGNPALERGDGLAAAFKEWKQWLGC